MGGVISISNFFNFRCHTVPRVVSATGGMVSFNPVPEVEQLRNKYFSMKHLKIVDGIVPINEISGDQLDIIFYVSISDSQMFGVDLRTSPDLQETTRVFFNLGGNRKYFS